MSGLALLIPVAVGLGLLALGTFMWTLRSGQYEDLEGASQRILDDDEHGPAS
jgi:cbb3-type cytochrome oxidase maturation protein